MLIYALSLQIVQLEKVCKPKNILNEVNVFRFLLFVSTCPKHFICVYKIQYNSECLGCGPKRKQYSYLLICINRLYNISELLRLLYKIIFKCKEFDILDYKANFICIIIRFIIAMYILSLFILIDFTLRPIWIFILTYFSQIS